MKRPLFLAALTTAATLRGLAQTPALDGAQMQRYADQLSRQLQQSGAEAPALYPDEIEEVGPQSILAVKPRHRWISLTLDSELYYDNNIFYTEKDQQGSSVWLNYADLSLTPPPVEGKWFTFSPRVGYLYQWYLYSVFQNKPGVTDFDYDNADLYAQLNFTRGDWLVQLGFDWDRLLSHDPDDYGSLNQFYEEWVPSWTVQRIIRLGQRDALAFSYLGSYHFTQTENSGIAEVFLKTTRNNRWENNLIAAWSHNLTDRLVLQPYYRLLLANYTEIDRFDTFNSFGLGVVWNWNNYAYLRAFINYDLQESTDPLVPDYRRFSGGGGINVSVSF